MRELYILTLMRNPSADGVSHGVPRVTAAAAAVAVLVVVVVFG